MKEAFYQLLCPLGHYWTEEAGVAEAFDTFCPRCSEGAMWQNRVQELKDTLAGYICMEFYLLDSEKGIYRVPPKRAQKVGSSRPSSLNRD